MALSTQQFKCNVDIWTMSQEENVEQLPKALVKEVIPTKGMLFEEEEKSFVLCKPKLMPLKSITLEKLETMQREAEEKAKQQILKTNTNSEET